MYRLGIIEESVDDKKILCGLTPYFISQRMENVPEDECPIWHINEEKLFVILTGKWFQIALKRDETWNEMIEYGVGEAQVERGYLETIPLHI